MPVINKKIKGVQITHNQSTHLNDVNTRHVTDAEKGNWNGAVTKANDWNSFKANGGTIGKNLSVSGDVMAADNGNSGTFKAAQFRRKLKGTTLGASYSAGFGVETKNAEDKVILGVGTDGDGYKTVFPLDHNAYNLGTFQNQWSQVFSKNGMADGDRGIGFPSHDSKMVRLWVGPEAIDFISPEGQTPRWEPLKGNAYNLGSPAYYWRDLWLGQNSITEQGYTKLPNGMIMQWGDSICENGLSQVTVTLPIAFPQASLVVLAIPHTTTSPHACYIATHSYGRTSAIFSTYRETGRFIFKWIAIGY